MAFTRQALTLLKEEGYKMTPQRIEILSILDNAEGTVTAYEIKDKLDEIVADQNKGKKKGTKTPQINISTVYRVLELFEELGIIHRIISQNGYIKCTKTLGDTENTHHFIICTNCGNTEEFCQPRKAPTIRPKMFKVKDMFPYYELHGICHVCRDALKL